MGSRRDTAAALLAAALVLVFITAVLWLFATAFVTPERGSDFVSLLDAPARRAQAIIITVGAAVAFFACCAAAVDLKRARHLRRTAMFVAATVALDVAWLVAVL